jgi:hypothetical protein
MVTQALSGAPVMITLVEDKHAQAAIFVSEDVMAPDKTNASNDFAGKEAEKQRRRLRESARDLAYYLEKISGAKIEVVTNAPTADDKRMPILIGGLAEAMFGPPQKPTPFRQGFRVVIDAKGIGLVGESDLATSYAIYELLERLGCRWFMPSEMGECIPDKKRLTLPTMDISSAPATVYRDIWYGDEDFRRRNRQGGVKLENRHALEFFISDEQREQHPDWRAMVGGKPHFHSLKWTHPEVQKAIAESIMVKLDKNPSASVSISPRDGMAWDESVDTEFDAGDYDDANNRISKTDRLIYSCNAIADMVTERYPKILLGLSVYADYTRPPVRERIHPNIVPVIAPITYNRHRPMTAEGHPAGKSLLNLLEGYSKRVDQLGYYAYAYNLGEVTAPFPMIQKWSTDLPIILNNNCKFWMPETMANFEYAMPALYLGMRLSWKSDENPAEIIGEIMGLFYGSAGDAMEEYYAHIDSAWASSGEYSGDAWGYMKIFTLEVMRKARKLMDKAKMSCKTHWDRKRVKIADECLQQLELFMKMRRDLLDGRVAQLEEDSEKWCSNAIFLSELYKDQYCFVKFGTRSEQCFSFLYFSMLRKKTYQDISQISKDFEIVTSPPLRTWHYRQDPKDEGVQSGWFKPGFEYEAWETTDTGVETWSSLGLYSYFGLMWYRNEHFIPKIESPKKMYLWLSATDGSARIFVNGQPIHYVDDKGKELEEFKSYAQPASFEITKAVRFGEKNEIAILCRRDFLNELGTGGLLGPVFLYRER